MISGSNLHTVSILLQVSCSIQIDAPSQGMDVKMPDERQLQFPNLQTGAAVAMSVTPHATASHPTAAWPFQSWRTHPSLEWRPLPRSAL